MNGSKQLTRELQLINAMDQRAYVERQEKDTARRNNPQLKSAGDGPVWTLVKTAVSNWVFEVGVSLSIAMAGSLVLMVVLKLCGVRQP